MNDIKTYEQAFERIKDQLNYANQEAKQFKGPCIKCAHCVSDFVSSFVLSTELTKYECRHPLVIGVIFDRMSGEVTREYCPLGYGDRIRPPKLCGENRQLFEPSLFWPVIKAILSLTFLALVVFVFWPY
jgi:hypothetical protein